MSWATASERASGQARKRESERAGERASKRSVASSHPLALALALPRPRPFPTRRAAFRLPCLASALPPPPPPQNPRSFFQPYYRVLPQSYSNMPVFWGSEELALLEGSYVMQQAEDRRANIRADYDLICRVVAERGGGGGGAAGGAGAGVGAGAGMDFAAIASFEDFVWARMVVASRNFVSALRQRERCVARATLLARSLARSLARYRACAAAGGFPAPPAHLLTARTPRPQLSSLTTAGHRG